MSNIPIEDFYLIKLLMIELKMDINQPDQKGLTPLLYASYSGNYCIVRYILANCAEANIMAVDNEMNNILHLACLSRSKLTGMILIEHAKQCGKIEKLINGKNHHEQIPLHLAAKKLMPTLIKELLFCGSPWDCYDSFGYSPSLYCTPTRLSAICLSIVETFMVRIDDDDDTSVLDTTQQQQQTSENISNNNSNNTINDESSSSIIMVNNSIVINSKHVQCQQKSRQSLPPMELIKSYEKLICDKISRLSLPAAAQQHQPHSNHNHNHHKQNHTIANDNDDDDDDSDTY